MSIDYHALLPINGKKFKSGTLTAVVVSIPGKGRDGDNVQYLTRFEESSVRGMLNLWVGEASFGAFSGQRLKRSDGTLFLNLKSDLFPDPW